MAQHATMDGLSVFLSREQDGAEITGVRRVERAKALSRAPADDDGAVWLGPEDVVEDGDADECDFLYGPDRAFVTVVLRGPAFFGAETQRKIRALADRLRALDLSSPRAPHRCPRHVMEGALRLALQEEANLDLGW